MCTFYICIYLHRTFIFEQRNFSVHQHFDIINNLIIYTSITYHTHVKYTLTIRTKYLHFWAAQFLCASAPLCLQWFPRVPSVCVCVWERERVKMCVCTCTSCMCVCVWERERVRMSVCMPLIPSMISSCTYCMCVCVCAREREDGCVRAFDDLLVPIVCMYEWEREKQGVRESVRRESEYMRLHTFDDLFINTKSFWWL